MKEKKRATLEDVAQRVGCSKSAVSYAILRNHPLSDELKAKIWNAIEELGYRPYGGRSKPKKQAIGLFCAAQGGSLLELFRKEVWKRGFIPLLYLLPNNITDETFGKTFGTLLNTDPNLAGIINIHPDINSFDLIKRCSNVPAVIYCREDSMCSQVVVRVQSFGKMAAGYIGKLGHPKVAFLEYRNLESRFNDLILEALTQELRQRNPEITLNNVWLEPGTDCREPLERLFNAGTTLFFACSIDPVIPILQWAYANKRWIPEDISVFCIDYAEEAVRLSPAVTTLSLPHEKLIEFTVNELLCRMRNQKIPEEEFQPLLIDRGTASRWKMS